ncbi:hypothetical protein MMC30_007475 [Trapelia coarctata]|nr:hypothetical protein [Trapelia coarctata]
MRFYQLLIDATLWSALVAASPYYGAVTSSIKANGAAYTPCATVSSLWAQQTDTVAPLVPIQLAKDCLNSVPIVPEEATKLVKGMLPYLQFQSTLVFLKDPPKDYPLPAVEILGGIQKIANNIANGVYPGEYAFQLDVWDLFTSAHDNHLVWNGDVLGSAIDFQKGWRIVSVSDDGQALPSVYMLEDVHLSQGRTSLGYKPSPVSTINGEDAISFLKKFSLDGSLQDLDALYNSNFFSIADHANNDGFLTGTPHYPGAYTSFIFANGTQHNYTNYAVVVGNFSGVYDGPSFYNKFCTAIETPVPSSTGAPPPAPTVPAKGYPSNPVVIHSEGVVGGYFLDGPGQGDIAVLSILSFEPNPMPQTSGQEFQAVIQEFLAAAKAAGKTKLIIDLQSNGGGRITLGYDAFKQLFPNLDPYGGSVFRAHSGLDFIGQGLNDLIQNPSQTQVDPQTLTGQFDMNYKNDLTANGTVFTSWKELFGPQEAHGDNFTSILRLKLDEPDLSLTSFPHINITGFANRANFTEPPFAPENIIMLTDGFCTSTCTIFAEFMKTQANVTSIVFGGRPQTGPMQAIGGSKGSEVMPWQDIYNSAALVIAGSGSTSPTDDVQLTIDTSPALQSTTLAHLSSYPLDRSLAGSINFKNHLRAHDPTLTPLQFTRDAADCRLFFTPKMINDVSEIWRVAARAAWGGRNICVQGSTGDKSSLTGMGRVDNAGFTSKGGAVVVMGAGAGVSGSGVTVTATATGKVLGATGRSEGVGRGVGWGMVGLLVVGIVGVW